MTQKIRVIAVIPGSESGVSMIFVKRQIDSLREHGVLIETVYIPQWTPWVVWKTLKTIRSLVKTFKPHILHAHYGTATSFLCSLLGIRPLVITFRGDDLNYTPDFNLLKNIAGKTLSFLSILCASRIICVSAQLRSSLPYGKSKSLIIPSGIDINLFLPQDRITAKKKIGLNPERHYILLNIGKEPILKGLPLVKKAIEIVKKTFPQTELLLISGQINPEKMPLYINASSCVVMASKREGSPNIIKEALACTTPIVSVDVGDVCERLEGITSSFIVERTPHGLAEGIMRALRSDRSNGREFLASIDKDAVSERIIDAYRSLL